MAFATLTSKGQTTIPNDARKLIDQALSRDEPVLVSLLVLLESEWVLRSRYGFGRWQSGSAPRYFAALIDQTSQCEADHGLA
jgi:hypothetical protein